MHGQIRFCCRSLSGQLRRRLPELILSIRYEKFIQVIVINNCRQTLQTLANLDNNDAFANDKKDEKKGEKKKFERPKEDKKGDGKDPQYQVWRYTVYFDFT